VNTLSAKSILAESEGNHDLLIIDFGAGVGIWIYGRGTDGTDFWFQLHPQTADAMVAVDSDGSGDTDSAVFSFAGADCGSSTGTPTSGPS